MDVRVWGVVEDRLIELLVEPSGRKHGIRIVGLPEGRARTTADRVRAALLNCGLVREVPSALIRLQPPVAAGTTSDLDLALAVAAHADAVGVGQGLRWILANGRLGLDGTVHAPGVAHRLRLADVVENLCRTPLLESERMFEREAR